MQPAPIQMPRDHSELGNRRERSSANERRSLTLQAQSRNLNQTIGGTTPTSGARHKPKKLLNSIKVFDQDNSKLKRLTLFLSEEKLEQAKNIIENFKKKRTEQGGDTRAKKKEQDDSSSSTHSSDMLENLTENSRYSTLNEF